MISKYVITESKKPGVGSGDGPGRGDPVTPSIAGVPPVTESTASRAHAGGNQLIITEWHRES